MWTIDELENRLSEPTEAAIETLRQIEGDLLFIGAGGKMGPTLVRMARRASDAAGTRRTIYAFSRFSEAHSAESLSAAGVEILRGDLFDDVLDSLPDVPNIVVMTGTKFGTSDRPDLTWAMNTWVPARICERFQNASRLVAFSTGNVYPLVPVSSAGAAESTPLVPIGEYGMSALGRERTYEFFCRRFDLPTALIRLNYAVELRYGVLVDLARKVYNEEPVDVSMGTVNVIWQGDANALALCALREAAVPARPVNVAGPEILQVREVCERLGELLGKKPQFTGCEQPDALLNDGSMMRTKYGQPRLTVDELLPLIAEWIRGGGTLLAKPTHFENRSGTF